jgi:hypothetical protein
MSGENTFANIIFSGAWQVRTAGGEYLDVDSEQGETPRLVTRPLSRLHHLFRVRSFEELSQDRWAVWAEPERISEGPQPVVASGSPGQYLFPFVLVHRGCRDFVLESLPEAHALAATSAVRESTRAVAEFSLPGEANLPLAFDAFTFVNTPSTQGFPVFQGDEKSTFDWIAAQLQFDPHSSLLTLAALLNLVRPPEIPQAAWDAVLTQLRREIDFRELARNYFGRVEQFVQNVFISNAGLVDNVATIIALDRDDMVQFVLNKAFSAMAGAVGGLGFPGAGVVSGALSALFTQLAKDKGPSASEFSVTVAEARSKMSALFDTFVTLVQNWRADVFADWGKLKTMGENLKSGRVAWPDNDEEMRKEAKRQLEIGLYQDMLKVRWNHMLTSNGPEFHKDVNWTSGYIEKNKNYWLTWVAYTQKDLFGKETKGYNVTSHWLGRGSTIFDHKQPDDRLPIRLFKELLVPRETAFMQWALRTQTFIVNTGGGIR